MIETCFVLSLAEMASIGPCTTNHFETIQQRTPVFLPGVLLFLLIPSLSYAGKVVENPNNAKKSIADG